MRNIDFIINQITHPNAYGYVAPCKPCRFTLVLRKLFDNLREKNCILVGY